MKGICEYCGSEIKDAQSKFCGECGMELGNMIQDSVQKGMIQDAVQKESDVVKEKKSIIIYNGMSIKNANKIMKHGFKSSADAKDHDIEMLLGDGVYFSMNREQSLVFASQKSTGSKHNALIKVVFTGQILEIDNLDEIKNQLEIKQKEGYNAIKFQDEINAFDVDHLNQMPREMIEIDKKNDDETIVISRDLARKMISDADELDALKKKNQFDDFDDLNVNDKQTLNLVGQIADGERRKHAIKRFLDEKFDFG